MIRLLIPSLILLALLGTPTPVAAKTPSATKVRKDVIAHWKKTWPDQELSHVARKSEKCEAGEIEIKRRRKPKKIRTCLLKADVYVAKGYRYLIYRATEVHYRGNRLLSVQLGELEKAWKAGGVPAPTPEQVTDMLLPEATSRLGRDPKITIRELGVPRPYGETYRLTLLIDVEFTKEGKQDKREKLFASFESDGGDWRPIANLLF
jgi:hypothetical protein